MLKQLARVIICFLVCTGVQAQTRTSPTEVAGGRFDGPGSIGDSNATFAIGLSRDGGTTFEDSARLTDSVSIVGIIRPEAAQIGQIADLFIVDRVNGTFTMRNSSGVYENWTTGQIADLVPFLPNQTLAGSMQVDIFTGQLGASGEHKLFLGYKATDGVLRFTPFPHIVNITEQSAIDQARELFDTNISPNLVQGVCIQCHVAGGQAAGLAQNIFVSTFNSNHLSLNFGIFQSLLNSRGRNFILQKTRGLQGHIGGAVLTTAMQEYKDLDTFLQLLEQSN